jgi:hypothetical protein
MCHQLATFDIISYQIQQVGDTPEKPVVVLICGYFDDKFHEFSSLYVINLLNLIAPISMLTKR